MNFGKKILGISIVFVLVGLMLTSSLSAQEDGVEAKVLAGKGVHRALSLLMGQYAFGNLTEVMAKAQDPQFEEGKFVGQLPKVGMRVYLDISDRSHIYILASGIDSRGMWTFYSNDANYYRALPTRIREAGKSDLQDWRHSLDKGGVPQEVIAQAFEQIPAGAVIHYILRRGR